MDKILDRLGIYDLWGVLIPGIIGCVGEFPYPAYAT